jgi:general secretion pathway protein G
MNPRHSRPGGTSWRQVRGFTMIELVVVMAILGLLLSIAVPRFMDSLERGREHVLEHNLAQMRQAIDRYYGDRGAYPDRLDDLVQRRYLRAVPVNPYTETTEWQVIGPPSGQKGSVYDVAEPDEARAARLRSAEPAGPGASVPESGATSS